MIKNPVNHQGTDPAIKNLINSAAGGEIPNSNPNIARAFSDFNGFRIKATALASSRFANIRRRFSFSVFNAIRRLSREFDALVGTVPVIIALRFQWRFPERSIVMCCRGPQVSLPRGPLLQIEARFRRLRRRVFEPARWR